MVLCGADDSVEALFLEQIMERACFKKTKRRDEADSFEFSRDGCEDQVDLVGAGR